VPVPFLPGIRLPEGANERSAWFVFRGDQLLVRVDGDSARLPNWADLSDVAGYDTRHYLGRLDGVDCFTVELEGTSEPPPDMAFEGLRALFGRLPEDHFSVAGRAVQVVLWDRTHRFCGRCGEPTVRLEAERARRCPRCGLLSFPRVSPAVIVRVERDDAILLGRNVAFQEGMYSCLAGFVEPGEELEETVAREVYEEASIVVRDVRYFASQPWPFPHSLMVGFVAQYAGGEIRVDPTELADAGWFTRDTLPRLPSKMSIARKLIDDWLTSRQPTSRQPSAVSRQQ